MKLLPDDSLKLLSVLVTLDSIPAGAAPGSIASPSTRFLGRRKVGRRNFSLLGNSITGHSGGSSTYIFPPIFSCPLSLCFAVSSGEYLFTFHFTRWSPCRKHLQGSASKRTVCLSWNAGGFVFLSAGMGFLFGCYHFFFFFYSINNIHKCNAITQV